MYIAIAILAAIFAVNAPSKAGTPTASPRQTQVAPATKTEVPVLIDSRFPRNEAPWEKSTAPAAFLPSTKTC